MDIPARRCPRHRSQALLVRWPGCLKPSSPLLAGIGVGLKPPSPLRGRNGRLWRIFRAQRCPRFQWARVGGEQWCRGFQVSDDRRLQRRHWFHMPVACPVDRAGVCAYGCSGCRRARPLCVPVGGGPPASRPRCELRLARRLVVRPGPATAHRHGGRSLRRPPHRQCLVCRRAR